MGSFKCFVVLRRAMFKITPLNYLVLFVLIVVAQDTDLELENPEYAQDFNLDLGFSFDVGKFPKKLELPVNVYLAPSWIRNHGRSKARRRAEEVVIQANLILTHRSLDTKFELKTKFINHNQDFEPSENAIFSNSIPSSNLEIGTIHMLLTFKNNNNNMLGAARLDSVCGLNNRRASAITSWNRDEVYTALTFAHEIAHTLGIHHDFEENRHRTITCGPSKLEGGRNNQIMNAGRPRSSTWSKCSNTDFKHYYTTVFANEAKFCLRVIDGPVIPNNYVNCGGHTAKTCQGCPKGNGKYWCNGECQWRYNQCQKNSFQDYGDYGFA